MKKVWINGQIIELTDEQYKQRMAAVKSRFGKKPNKTKNTDNQED